MCVLRVIVWPETWSLSMACVVGVPCVCTFDRHIIYMCSRNTQEPSLLSERAAARARAPEERSLGKAWCGDFRFVPHDPIFYAGVLGRGWKETFDRSEPPTLLVTVGVNRYSHFFSFLIKNGPKTLHGRPQRQPWCAYLS